MSTAKPQQMSADADTSDDLIAELAKLMADDAQGSRPAPAAEPKEAPKAAAPAPQTAAPPVQVRIPGGEVNPNPPAQQAAPATPLKFDFGKAPSAPPIITPEPLTWHEQQAKTAESEMRREPTFAGPTSAVPQGRLPDRGAASESVDFDFGFGERSASDDRPAPQQPQPKKLEPLAFIEPKSSFDPVPKLDVPAKVQQPASQSPMPLAMAPKSEPTPVAPQAAAPASSEHDFIADLIAAELEAEPAKPSATVTPLQPASPTKVQATPIQAATPQKGGAWANITAANATPMQKPANGPALRAVNLTPKPTAESDKFRTAPVFGLTGKTGDKVEAQSATPMVVAPKPAPVDLDPIDEIESLIGEAVRVELGSTPEPQIVATPPAQKSAVVTPINTPFSLRRGNPKPEAKPEPVETAPDSAEEAILAAAAATGAEVGRIETEFEEKPAKRRKQKRQPREDRPSGSFRQFVGPAVAGTLLLLAGFGLYWVLGMGRGGDTVAPVLTADTTTVKEQPAAVVDTDTTQGSVVFGELDGVDTGADETLVSRDQAADVDVAAVTAATEETAETTLANRKVRTVTVRPDGTIVSGDDAVAGSAELPVDRPNVPDLPETATALAASDLLAGGANDAGALPEDASALTSPDTALTTDATGGITAPSLDPTIIDPNIPVPMPRPTWRDPSATVTAPDTLGETQGALDTTVTQPVTAIVSEDPPTLAAAEAALTDTPAATTGETPVVEVASVDDAAVTAGPAIESDATPSALVVEEAAETPVTAPEPDTTVASIIDTEPTPEPIADVQAVDAAAVETPSVPTPATTDAAAWVQVSSQRSEADALATKAQMENRFGPLFNGTPLEIQRADLGAKGIYYRVVLPVDSKASAAQICGDLVEAGGECITR